ncbi:MAG: FG-GAP repeat domain-containing protein, partial [Aeoliella sp.]
ADYDNDGDQDLYVANDYGKNCLYRNHNGHFSDVADAAEVIDFGSGMSVDWADYDRDGHIDLYVGNMFSTAGGRITSQAAFLPDAEGDQRSIYARFAKGNTLFRNRGDGHFADVGAATGVEHARWAWSSVFADINNDGWEDLLVANGYVTGDDIDDL